MRTIKIIFLSAIVAMIGAAGAYGQSIAQVSQCDRANLSPIRCGYFDEGYIDGANDARNNQDNDYKRYKSKYENQYEQFYRQGYDSGFSSVRPFSRWTDEQKNTYDQGYDDGENDRDRRISRLPARYEGQYDRNYEAYFRKGYLDGFDDREKQYDVPIGGQDNFPGQPFPNIPTNRRGSQTGTLTWNGRVDNRVNIILKGSEVRTERVAGSLTNTYHNLSGVLPRRSSTLTVNKLDGRGTVFVTQQPSRANDYTAIIQVYDPRGGRDNYNIRVTWTANRQEAYRSGKLTWRGRVDAAVNIEIAGEDVDMTDATGTGVSNVRFDLEGYLAARPGNVRVNKRGGRGTVTVIEQPTAANDFTAVIRIFDPRGGDDEYEIEVTW